MQDSPNTKQPIEDEITIKGHHPKTAILAVCHLAKKEYHYCAVIVCWSIVGTIYSIH